ncbi:MAG: hypothetical protein IIB38_05500, partial [Candidatus Hydrogenedentes bacterium]|nr:hypothetical protein [Candidatus Hydrogenedentota bacterium]
MNSSWSANAQPPRSRCAIVAAIVVLGFVAYANTFHGEFVWDDASSILLHENVQDTSRFFQLFGQDQHAFAGGQGNFYRPLVSASFMLDYALSHPKSSPTGPPSSSVPEPGTFFFHLSSVSWHVLAAVFLFLLMNALGAPRLVCAVCPLVYVVHP